MNWIWITITDGTKTLTPRFNTQYLPAIGHEIAYDGISGHVQSVKWTRHDEVTITVTTAS